MPLFVESPSLVSDAIDGATLLDGHPGVRTDACSDIVVLRTLPASQTTAVLSGGGSGHEPAHAGFVGGGMLAGAVCGGVFAAPASAQAVRALSQLGRDAVLVAKNYTGDRLSFGRALERFAAVSGRAARLVVVADDCALPHARTAATGRRGLAGAVLVYKVAGEAARRGATVAAVAALAEEVARRVGTVGVAVRAASVELGLGIHGEPGFATEKPFDAAVLAKRLVDMIVVPDPLRYTVGINPTGHLVVLINNLGSATDLEINAFQKHVLLYIRDTYPSLASLRVITGRLMTSLQMHGLSLTLLVDATEEMLELLDAQPDNIGQWPGVVRVQLDQWKSTPSSAVGENVSNVTVTPIQGPSISADHAKVLKECIRIAAETMIASEERLTEFDTVAGDGDCGHTVKAGGLAILGVLDKLPFSHPASTLISISAVLETTMGGSSGVLYCIMLDAAAGFLSSCSNVSPESWAISLEKGLEAIIKYGGAKPGDRTMIDALHPLVQSLVQNPLDFDRAISKVKEGAKATESMQTARAGRSSYIGAALTVPDPGAYAVAAWVSAVISFLKQ